MADLPEGLSILIHGKEYLLARDPGKPDDHIREVAGLVDGKMRQMEREHGARSDFQTAVLAGLDLVDELLRLRADYSSAQSDIAARTSRLSDSVGRILEGGTVERPAADGDRDRSGQSAASPATSPDSAASADSGQR